MSAAAWLSGAVAAAQAAAQQLGLHEQVSYTPAVANDGGAGEIVPGSPVLLSLMVSRQQGARRKPGGVEIPYRVTVAFQFPIAVDMRDRIVLWDGVTGPIVDLDKGATDPTTGLPCATTAYLGYGG